MNRELTDKEFLEVIKRFSKRDDMTTAWLIEKVEKYEQSLKEIKREIDTDFYPEDRSVLLNVIYDIIEKALDKG